MPLKNISKISKYHLPPIDSDHKLSYESVSVVIAPVPPGQLAFGIREGMNLTKTGVV